MRRREISRTVSDAAHIPSLLDWLSEMVIRGLHAGEVLVSIGRPRRNLDQNAKLWALLSDISTQCQLVIGGALTRASPED